MHVIVVNNIKGGCGKTTIAINIISSLLNEGLKVGSLDCDINQFSLTRFMENRENNGKDYLMPHHFQLQIDNDNKAYDFSQQECLEQIAEIFENLKELNLDFLVIDTPAGDTFVSDIILNYADKIITPVNESLIDLDLIIRQNDGYFIPGIFSQKIWEKKMYVAEEFHKKLNWYLMRNRISPMRSKSSKSIIELLENNQENIGYKLVDGFCERVIFKELFNHGVTLLDLISYNQIKLSPSHLAAKQELRNFMKAVFTEKVIAE